MDKLTMAHDWAMKHGSPDNFKLTVDEAWEYADAMQAEADKRVDTDRPDVFTKDMHGNCRHMHKTLHGAECFDCGEALNLSNSKPLESLLHDIDCYFDKTDNTQRDANNLIQSVYERLSGEVLKGTESSQLESEPKPLFVPAPKPKQYACNCAHWKNSSFFMGDTFTCKDCGGSVTI